MIDHYSSLFNAWTNIEYELFAFVNQVSIITSELLCNDNYQLELQSIENPCIKTV